MSPVLQVDSLPSKPPGKPFQVLPFFFHFKTKFLEPVVHTCPLPPHFPCYLGSHGIWTLPHPSTKAVLVKSVQSLSCVWLFATPWTAACQASLSITNSWSLLKLMSIESVMPSNHLILCHPLLHLPPILPSIRVFLNELVLHIRWPKYWSFSFNISPSNEYSGRVSFRMDWVWSPGTLKNLIQCHSSKASILWRSTFFMVQLSHPYMIIGKTTALTRQTFFGKVMSLLFNGLGWS